MDDEKIITLEQMKIVKKYIDDAIQKALENISQELTVPKSDLDNIFE